MEIVEIKEYSNDVRMALNVLLLQLTGSAGELDEPDLRAIIEAERTHLFMALDLGRFCGTLTVVLMITPVGKRARIEDVVVLEEMRRRGIGRRLIVRAIQFARDQGASSVELTSHPSRQAAHALYLEMGFKRRETHTYNRLLRA